MNDIMYTNKINEETPIMTLSVVSSMINLMIYTLKMSAHLNDHTIVTNTYNSLFIILDKVLQNKKYDFPEKLLTSIYEAVNTSWELADSDIEIAAKYYTPSRDIQYYYIEVCNLAINEALIPAKLLITNYIASEIPKEIMKKRMATYDENIIGTIATLPNTLIDKIISSIQ